MIASPGIVPRIVAGTELLLAASSVHLLGGGYVNAIWPDHRAILAVMRAVADRSGAQIAATGQGLLPAGDDTTQRWIAAAAKDFDVFDVRDSESAALTGRTGSGVDDAWLGVADAGVYDRAAPAAARDFIFCLQGDLTDNDGAGFVADARAVIERWGITGDRAAFVECIPGVDRVVFDQVADLLPGVDFVPFTALWRRGLPVGAHQTWISSRFHPHLLAAAAGARGVTLSARHDYYPIKHNSLVALGSGWVPLDAAPQPPTSGGYSPAVVSAAHAAKLAVANAIYPPPAVAAPQMRRRWRP